MLNLRAAPNGLIRVSLVATFFLASSSASAQRFAAVQDVPAPTNPVELMYSPLRAKLVIKNTASVVAVLDLASGATTYHFANTFFTDMSMSPDEASVFVADYGG